VIQRCSFSTLKHFAKTPAHALEYILHPEPPTAAQGLGQALHCAVLEPARFDGDYAVPPKVDRRTKIGKATWDQFEASHPGCTMLKMDDLDVVSGIREAVHAHPFAAQLIQGAKHVESCVTWECKVVVGGEEVSIPCKSRLDLVTDVGGWTWVADLKSVGDYAADASPNGFAKAVANHSYHAQAAFYMDALDYLSPRQRRFVWIAAESDRPYCVGIYEPDDAMLEQGRALYRRWLFLYAQCKAENSWPGYSSEPEVIVLPAWAQGVSV
jgi:exodeoxyribonuclease VIII